MIIRFLEIQDSGLPPVVFRLYDSCDLLISINFGFVDDCEMQRLCPLLAPANLYRLAHHRFSPASHVQNLIRIRHDVLDFTPTTHTCYWSLSCRGSYAVFIYPELASSFERISYILMAANPLWFQDPLKLIPTTPTSESQDKSDTFWKFSLECTFPTQRTQLVNIQLPVFLSNIDDRDHWR